MTIQIEIPKKWKADILRGSVSNEQKEIMYRSVQKVVMAEEEKRIANLIREYYGG